MANSKGRLKLDSRGLNAALNTYVTPALERAAKQVESNLPSGYRTGVVMGKDRTGRPRAMIAVMEPFGLQAQAKRGLLTRAAAKAGLDIHRYPIEGG